MRKIKFRAWDKENKKMICFDFNNIYGYEGETCGVILPDKLTELNFNSGYGMDGINKNLEIMQYIGLKDKNGKEIYEGDIIQYKNITKGEVKYSEEYAQYVLVNTGTVKDEFEPLGDYNMEVFEVIRKHI